MGSKQIGNFDITLGLGWGRFAERASFRNPLALLNDSFNYRGGVGDGVGRGGKPRLEDQFRGKAAFSEE